MATPCPVCQQHNPDSALYCEFCKTAFRGSSPPKRAASSLPAAGPIAGAAPRQAPDAGSAPPSSGPGAPRPRSPGLSLPLVGLVAVVSAGLGFVAGELVGHARPGSGDAAETSAPVPPPVAPPPAEPAAAPPRTAAEESKVAGAPLAAPAPAVAEAAPSPSPSAQAQPVAPAPVSTAAPVEPPVPALRQISVPYKAFEGQAQRIIISVKLNGRVTASMLLDTGAPGTVLFTPLAERLGVLDEGSNHLVTTAAGIGGRTKAMFVILDSLSVDEARTEFVPATVTAPMTDAFEGLVGMDFLAGYSVHIDTQRHRLVLTEMPESSARPAGHDEAWWRRTFTQMEGQRTYWQQYHAKLEEEVSHSLTTNDGSAELVSFAERQAREAELLATRLERYASNNAVPREWRRE